MSQDAGTESRVITADVTDPHDIKASFDLILYKKVSFGEIAENKDTQWATINMVPIVQHKKPP